MRQGEEDLVKAIQELKVESRRGRDRPNRPKLAREADDRVYMITCGIIGL